ncbi:MAG: polya polymerase [Eubacteriales bacterium]|nr:polya polymerase [Eubacteriales bacterium]
MKIENISDVESFFKVIDACKGPVELISPEGDRINLKSKLSQYLSMASIFSNGYIKELDLVARDKEDVERLIKYMYQGA